MLCKGRNGAAGAREREQAANARPVPADDADLPSPPLRATEPEQCLWRGRDGHVARGWSCGGGCWSAAADDDAAPAAAPASLIGCKLQVTLHVFVFVLILKL